jgi:LysM repeat protein
MKKLIIRLGRPFVFIGLVVIGLIALMLTTFFTGEGTVEALDQQIPAELLNLNTTPGTVELIIRDKNLLAKDLKLTSEAYKLGQVVYVVNRGETLGSIARYFGSTVDAIQSANNIVNPNLIYAGQRLIIPIGDGDLPPFTKIMYVVQRGDTLSGIAYRYHTTIWRLSNDNWIRNPNIIYIGQRLIVYPNAY